MSPNILDCTRKRGVVAVMLAMVLGLLVRQAQAQDLAIEPEQAGPEFRIQGEYKGTVGGSIMAIQVRAPGPGKFTALVLKGGFPGEAWDGIQGLEVTGTLASGNGVFSGGGYSFTIPALGTDLTGTGPTGAISLSKVMRGSRSMGMVPPPGADILFNGTGVDNFRLGARFDATRKLLYTGARTKPDYKSVRMHVEFRTCWKINGLGQLRSNSGVLFKDRWEIQILDSYGTPVPKTDDCGAMYGQFPEKYNMCLPPLSWQTFDIDFKDVEMNTDGTVKNQAAATVYHNGVLVHYKKSFTGITLSGSNLIPGPDGTNLQAYGSATENPVFYRNLWAVPNPPDLLDTAWFALNTTSLGRGAFSIRPMRTTHTADGAWVGIDGRLLDSREVTRVGRFGAWFPLGKQHANQTLLPSFQETPEHSIWAISKEPK